MALSGGVDSAVSWRIAQEALGPERVMAISVDTGFSREGAVEEIQQLLGTRNIDYVNAAGEFYAAIEAIPYNTGDDEGYYALVREQIGQTFFRVFHRRMRTIPNVRALIQGTNYADAWESLKKLKQHHNLVEPPEDVEFEQLVEPIARLHKPETRLLAAYLKLPREIVGRQPTPGPELAIRGWGPVTRDRTKACARANRITEEVIRAHYPDPHTRPSQYYVAFAPLPTCAYLGDARNYGLVWVLRAFDCGPDENYASAAPFRFRPEVEEELTQRLTREITMPDGTRFVDLHISRNSKPPLTIELH
ncbi:MAG: hypothetical protein HY006_02085 [Candidatus Sungbacteria bacterium]|nr:hypothetical protein [Candidatus Sungbacteria bacterium]